MCSVNSLVILLGYLAYITDGLMQTSNLENYNIRRLFKRQAGESECTLPPYPKNGDWKVLNSNVKPGDKVPTDSVVKFKCKSGFKLSTDSPYLICDENWNSLEIPECEELCPPLYSSDVYQLTCLNRKGKQIKCSEASHGSYLEYNCVQFYETPFGYRKTLLCENGSWNNFKPICQPVCGKKIRDDGRPYIFGSKPNEKLEYPWIAALYRKVNGNYTNICGGSILSRTIVLTAAHCVTNDMGDAYSADLYMIGVGKLYNQYQDSRDTRAQYKEISKITVHEQYKGDNKRYLADIAVLVIKGEFNFNEVVQPVCFNNLNDIPLIAGKIGEISGWGRTEGGNASDALRTLKIPYKYETTCATELPQSWAIKYNMIDKICAGFVNKSTSVCDGDSGGGFVFENPEDNRYYVHGIVSLGHQSEGECNIEQNALYTKVAFYYDFVDKLLTKYAPEVKDCPLPPHPENGKWIIKEEKKIPGDLVSSNTILNVQCNEGFKLSTSTSTILCDSTYSAMPTCQANCPTLDFPQGTDFQCINKGQSINCSEASEGAQLFYSCPKRYVIPENSKNDRVCSKGSWGSPQPKCIPIVKNCGKRISTADTSDKSENYKKQLDNPWLTLIYHEEDIGGYAFYCSGSVLSNYIVLTAAHCVTNHHGSVSPAEKFSVVAGKVYSEYNNSKDTDAQHRKLSKIMAHPGYRGENRNYLADIAILVVDKPFIFNDLIQPICFHGVDTIRLHPGDVVTVFGWKVKDDGLLNELESSELQFKDEVTCKKGLPESWADRFFVFDKICAGNEVKPSICRGDTGKAFAVKNPEDDRVYIHGLVSIGPVVVDTCSVNSLSTNVSFYYEFIEKELSKYKYVE